MADGLGRLQEVVEDPQVTTGSAVATAMGVSNPNGASVVTNYSYNALDKLTIACQGSSIASGVCNGSQPRTFTYDGLGRLLTAQNPENGLSTYTYDPNGNVLSVAVG